MPVIDLNIINSAPVSERSKNMYRHTIMELNKKLGFEKDDHYYLDTDWYIENFGTVVETIKSRWTINTKRDLTTRLNHIQSVYKTGAPLQIAQFRRLVTEYADQLPTNVVAQNIPDWTELKERLYEISKNRDSPHPLRMVYLFYSYGYVFRPHELLATSVLDPEHPNYLNLDTGEYRVRETKNGKERNLVLPASLLSEIVELRDSAMTTGHNPLISHLGEFYKDGYKIRHPPTVPNVYQIRSSYETFNFQNSETLDEAQANAVSIGHSANTAMDNYVQAADNCHPLLKPYIYEKPTDMEKERLLRKLIANYKPVCPWTKKNQSSICVELKKIKDQWKTQGYGECKPSVMGDSLRYIFGKLPTQQISNNVKRKGWIFHPTSDD